MERLLDLARRLKGARILHINSTTFGGGVAEILYTLVPITKDLGLDVEWRVMECNAEFFAITKVIHNGLQGMPVPFTREMAEIYTAINANNARALDGNYDYVLVHDPQPAAMLSAVDGTQAGKWVWRCHIDLTAADDTIWTFVKPFVERHDAAIFTMPEFAKPDLRMEKVAIIPPTIDPISPKNTPLDEGTMRGILLRHQVDPDRPIVTQVSRFDPWKDPIGVIDAFRIARERVPGIQLLMIASMATDDPEGWHYYEKASRYSAGDPDIRLLSNLEGIGNLEVNAFQTASQVVVQKSTREGFGLVVAEALWKERPVIGGDVGGIKLQILDGVNGYLVDSVEACAERLVYLLKNPELAGKMGAAGREHIRRNFLSPRELADYLTVFTELP